PSTARATSSALVIDPSKVSTPRPLSHSGIDVSITRMSFEPDSIRWRTRCDPRKPVPPVIRVEAGTFLTMAACRFVLFFGTICAVRFFGGVLGMDKIDHRGHREEKDNQPGRASISFRFMLFCSSSVSSVVKIFTLPRPQTQHHLLR